MYHLKHEGFSCKN